MKISGFFLVAAASLVGADAAHAAVLFDTITGVSQLGVNSVTAGSGASPLGDSFAVKGVGTLNSVWLDLGATSTTDGGSVLVYIVPDAGGAPSHVGLTLTNRTLLGSFNDSALLGVSGSAANPTLHTERITTNFAVTTGTYWIQLVDGSDTANGGTSLNPTSAVLGDNLDGSGVGTAGQFYSNNNGNNSIGVSPDEFGPYRMTINATITSTDVPEPTSFAILGAGVIGLGLSRQRVKKHR